MKRFGTRAVSMCTIALLLTVAATAIGAASRPLKLKGRSEISPPGPGGSFTTTGTGTHLGKFTGAGTVTFSPGEDEEAGFIVGEGQQTFTAANGDTLDTTFRGLLDPGTGKATVFFEIEGGTGRFEDADGDFVAHATQDPNNPLAFTFTTTGTITY